MQLWSLYWHLRQLTDQPMVVSGIGLVRFLPVIVFSLLAGVTADAFDRRKTTIVTQLAQAAAAFALGVSTLLNRTSLWMLFCLVAVQAIASTFDIPARQALIPSLVPKEDLASAYSLTTIAAKVGGIVGASISGLVIAYMGLQWAYWLNAISYLAVILALLAIGRIPNLVKNSPHLGGNPIADVKAGFKFMKESPVILSVIIVDFFGTFFASAKTLLPFVATDILQVGAVQYGWLSSAQSVGTLMTGVYLSQKHQLRRQGLLISGSVIAFGLSTVLFGLSRSFWLTMAALFLIGIFDGFSSIIRNTVRQLLTPDEMRGRMMSITQISTKGGPQLGEVESGLAAQWLGVPLAIITGGVGCILAAVVVIKKIPSLLKFEGVEPLEVATESVQGS
jgi:MFS family permease